MAARELPAGWEEELPVFDADPKGVATRAASGKVLDALAPGHARAVGRLGRPGRLEQHHHRRASRASCRRPADRSSRNPYGRTLHFGIREHAMGATMNGIALHGDTRPYGGTFLVFSDYMRSAVRLSALMHAAGHLRVDARLHRPRRGRPDPPAGRAPAALRAIPGLNVVRPADANETAVAWARSWRTTTGPPG